MAEQSSITLAESVRLLELAEKTTPGPFTVRQLTHSKPPWLEIHGEGDKCIVADAQVWRSGRPGTIEECRANADLFCESRTALPAALRQLQKAMATMQELFQDAHRDGCLWLADRRMPCQCGSRERIDAAVAEARALLREYFGTEGK